MEQVVERFPQLLGCSIENMKEHVEFLLKDIGVKKDKLGKVRFCLLFSYAFCEHFHDSSVHRGVNVRHFIGMVTNVSSPRNSLLMWFIKTSVY
jgi:hypothetical protein